MKTLRILFFLLLFYTATMAKDYVLLSPDKSVSVSFNLMDSSLTYPTLQKYFKDFLIISNLLFEVFRFEHYRFSFSIRNIFIFKCIVQDLHFLAWL